MAKSKSVVWPEKLDTSKTHRFGLPIVFLRLRQGNYKRNIVTRIGPHDFTGHHRPIQPLNPATWVLYNQRRRINRLAIPHLNSATGRLKEEEEEEEEDDEDDR